MVADKDDSAAGAGHFIHFAQAFPLKGKIANGEDLIDEQNLRLKMRRHGEGQARLHAAAIVLERTIQEFSHFGEAYDLVEFARDFLTAHAENCAVEIDVLASGELRMKAGADLEEAAHGSADLRPSCRWLGNPREDLEESGLPGPIPPDHSDYFAGLDLEGDVAQGPNFSWLVWNASGLGFQKAHGARRSPPSRSRKARYRCR